VRSGSRPGLGLWAGVLAGGTALEVWLLVGPLSGRSWTSPVGLFVIVTVAASLCAVAAIPVLIRGHRTDSAEVGTLGAAMFVLSVLPLVHGLTAPGVLYGPNPAVMTSVLLASPVAVVTCLPLLASRSTLGRSIARRWRAWTTACMTAAVALAAMLLVRPDVIPAPAPRSAVPLAVMVVCFGALVSLSWRQLRLYWISRHPAFLGAALAVVSIALTSTVWMGRNPFTIGWWAVHALDICGVFGVLGALWFAPRLRESLVEVLEPVLARDPLAAFEIGLAPVVHEFVAALERKDQVTRDHVVRVGELAGRTGEALHLPARELRYLILGALLHDVGKLGIEDAILTKPGRLTDDEYTEVQRHTVIGDQLLRAVPILVPVAPIVRAHHERPDGTGYPDRLVADAIPLAARIVAVCDAYDAMARTRHYRDGMGHDRAIAILREHAGTQWDPRIVTAVAALTEHDTTGIFGNVGHPSTGDVDGEGACSCVDALPETVQALLV
jgi:HD-GYP domain-containing protein (c-di-GMP phosphodiesterase class II)